MIIQDSHQGLDISPRYILFLSHFLAFFSISLFSPYFFLLILTLFSFHISIFPPVSFLSYVCLPSFLFSSTLPVIILPLVQLPLLYSLLNPSILPSSFFLPSFISSPHVSNFPPRSSFFPFLSFIHPSITQLCHCSFLHAFTSCFLYYLIPLYLSHVSHFIYLFLFLLSFLQNS